MSKEPVAFTPEKLRDEQGFPLEHTKAFLEVAQECACVILTRTPGSSCEGPLAEGYTAKSFHIKAKSCNWGATAGFLCLDPFMNKSGEAGALGNLIENYKSLNEKYDKNEKGKEKFEGKTSSVISLQISDVRLDWLINNKKLQGQYSSDKSCFIGSSSVGEITVDFLLLRDQILPESPAWRVYYDAGKLYGLGQNEKPASSNCTKAQQSFVGRNKVKEEVQKKKLDPQKLDVYFKKFWEKLVAESETWLLKNYPTVEQKYHHYVPALAMTNPHLEYDLGTIEGYKNAVTGDYDLFAVWPKVANKALDSRVAGMTAKTTNKDITSAEEKSDMGKVVGNISGRLYDIAQQLNTKIMQKTVGSKPGAYAVNRVFHSDEAGRPFLDGVDEAAVFTPDGKIFMVSPGKDDKGNSHAWQLSSLIRIYGKKNEKDDKGYTIFANVAWLNFLDDDVKNMITWSEAIPETAQPSATKK